VTRRLRGRRRTAGPARRRRAARGTARRGELKHFYALSEAGARNAATALSQILGRPLRLSVPWARVLPLHKVKEMAGGSSRVVCALSLKVYGEARGNLLVVFRRDQLALLLGMVIPRGAAGSSNGHSLTEMDRSALMEIGNILACAYLNALSHLLGVSLLPSIPGLAIDMVGAVTDHLLIELAALSDSAVVLASEVHEPASGLRGSIFFVPHPSALPVLGRAEVAEGSGREERR